jgi:hypothetical protein
VSIYEFLINFGANSIARLVFVMEAQFVFFEPRTEFLSIMAASQGLSCVEFGSYLKNCLR